MKKSSVEVWLWLLLVMYPHNPKTRELLDHYDSAEELARAIRDGECHGVSDSERQRAASVRSREVRQIMEECASNDIRIITPDDDEYPALLKNIYCPPVVLFVQGSLECLKDEVSLAVVGPRHPSDYAVKVGTMLCTQLARLGTVLVSGLAVGIDTVAHSCAVNNGIPTIGVLACGHLVNYPPENEQLKRRIVECGGAVISELLPHASVEPRYFRDRNRIISGLGVGTLIVEASTRSGCLLTANHTIDQGRDLFCVPPRDITMESCAGVVPFLRDGAIPVFDYLDIVHEYMYHYFSRLDEGTSASRTDKPQKRQFKPSPAAAPTAGNSANRQEKPAQTAPALSEEKLSALTETQRLIAKIVEKSPGTADEIVILARMPYTEVAEVLTDLEIADMIQLTPDGTYQLKQ